MVHVHRARRRAILENLDGPLLRRLVKDRVGLDGRREPEVELHRLGIRLKPVGDLVFGLVNRPVSWKRHSQLSRGVTGGAFRDAHEGTQCLNVEKQMISGASHDWQVTPSKLTRKVIRKDGIVEAQRVIPVTPAVTESGLRHTRIMSGERPSDPSAIRLTVPLEEKGGYAKGGQARAEHDAVLACSNLGSSGLSAEAL